MRFDIEISPDEAARRLTVRERIGIYLLFCIFTMIYPAKYSHQYKEFGEFLKELKEQK